jgi:hypothetical protein
MGPLQRGLRAMEIKCKSTRAALGSGTPTRRNQEARVIDTE